MTSALSELSSRRRETSSAIPLEFTRNLGGVFQDKLIAAFSKPVLTTTRSPPTGT